MKKQVILAKSSRRQFIQYGALAAGAAFLAGPYLLRGQNLNSRLNIAQIGIGVKGMSDAQWCSTENLVALCDIHSAPMDYIKQNLPTVKCYKDYRELFDKEKGIDAVDIATPDHSHAIIAATAIKLGKHVYCQKPLTHDVAEARLLRDLARQYKVATQMGNQGSASDGLRRAVEIVQAGLIGAVRQAYVWTNRPVWPQGCDRPAGTDPIPTGLDWDLWLGTAPARPYKEKWPDAQAAALAPVLRFTPNVYHPFNWRGWLDYGTGALGDMACHTVNWPFRALKLGYPTEVEATSSVMKSETYPVSSRIRFEFPAREGLSAVTLHWADGGNTPPAEATADIVATFGGISPSGCILIGEKGMLFSPDDGDQELRVFVKLKGDKQIVAAPRHEAVQAIAQTIPRNAFDNHEPPDSRHHSEWFAACKSGKHETAYSNFEIAAYLTEIILLGCVALRARQKLEWNGPDMKAKNMDVSRFLKRDYRAGWKV
jgi:predicted dehydrogenase